MPVVEMVGVSRSGNSFSGLGFAVVWVLSTPVFLRDGMVIRAAGGGIFRLIEKKELSADEAVFACEQWDEKGQGWIEAWVIAVVEERLVDRRGKLRRRLSHWRKCVWRWVTAKCGGDERW